MSKKLILLFTGILLCLNVLAWQEVFVLNQAKFLKIDFLSVGQGDSEFIETPEGYQILIDGGPSSAVLQKLAERMPFWDRTIDIVILTHPEKDHMTGLLDVLQRYNIKYFLWTGVVKDNPENKKLADLLQKAKANNNFLASLTGQVAKTKVVAVNSGQKIQAGSALIEFLYPFESVAGKILKASANDDCAVNKITYGKNSFIFTGDIDSKAEYQLANSYKLANLKANVLKVAHHGSKYSTSNLFLENVRPEYAVIEVGKNSYGHPTSEVLQRLENFGINTFITQRDGDIEFISDGKDIIKITN